MSNSSPEQELLDNLYELQSVRERVGVHPDFAVFGDELSEDCTYLVDYSTCTKEVDERGITKKLVYDGIHLVLTGLPADQGDFSGARISVSSQEGIELPNGTRSNHTIFAIGHTLAVQCFSLDGFNAHDFAAEVQDFSAAKLADMIRIPSSILPFPATVEDERCIPEDLESIMDPQNQTYTLGAGFFDRALATGARLIADRVGIKNLSSEEDPLYVYYRVRISEGFENFELRKNEFDRELHAEINFSEIIPFEVVGMGEAQPRTVMQSSILIKSTRESIYLYCQGEQNDTVLYKVTDKTRQIIDEILSSSDDNPATA